MVFLTLAQKVNQSLGPFLLRQSINARYAAAGGKLIVDNPTADAFCLLPLAQKMVDVEVYAAMRGNTDASERMGLLESYVRCALVPNEQWRDVQRWQFHQRLHKWLRRQYLIAQHGPELYQLSTAIRQSTQLAREKQQLPEEVGLSSIPTTATLIKGLGMVDWTNEKNTTAARSAMRDIVEQKLNGELLVLRGGAICFAHVEDPRRDVSHLTLSELLEVAGCHVMQCGAFNALCEEAEIYQFWTREYIQKLALYIQSRITMNGGKDTLLVDIGAGNGLLASLLRHAFEEIKTKSMGFKSRQVVPRILATDNGSWKIPLRAPVEPWSVEETMQRCLADDDDSSQSDIIVICSWMPLHQDWTRMFRNNNNNDSRRRVKEYILIGECDDGQCGDLWETWGNAGFLELEPPPGDDVTATATTTTIGRPIAPYEQDGYTRHELRELIPYQLSRFDCARSRAGRSWSFRRDP
jgi:hypothetical protein